MSDPGPDLEIAPESDEVHEDFEREFLEVLKEFGVLDAFKRMQPSHQSHFLSVIAMAEDPQSRRRRILTFVGALRASPDAGPHEATP